MEAFMDMHDAEATAGAAAMEITRHMNSKKRIFLNNCLSISLVNKPYRDLEH